MSDVSPAARRLSKPSWLDARVAVGVLLVMTSVVVGARVFTAAGRYTEVYLARRALLAGAHLSAGDLTTGRVRFDGGGGAYVAAGRPPVGYLVTRYVAAGELLPVGALSRSAPALTATRLVTVPVPAGHLPADLGRSDEVDVYLTGKPKAGGATTSRLLLDGVLVDGVTGSGSLSADDVSAVVLVVPNGQVAALVGAIEADTIDLVRVPATDLAR